MVKNQSRCVICNETFMRNGSHRKTCQNEECVKEHKKRSEQRCWKRGKLFFKNNSEVSEFLEKFNFNRKGFANIKRYRRALTTILTCFKEYSELDELSKLKIKENEL